MDGPGRAETSVIKGILEFLPAKYVPATGEAAQISLSDLGRHLGVLCFDLCQVRISTSVESTTAGRAGDHRPCPHLSLLSVCETDSPAASLSQLCRQASVCVQMRRRRDAQHDVLAT